ncbi:MAG: hypothetical protein OEZ06_25405 [Myxococcales bacterium]|nr:hypothetical protein [Myxococcales bacterium]
MLEGGLDCTTGEFRASAPAGVYGSAGSTDPFDPDALWTVTLPVGMFNGTLMGEHMADMPEAIRGEWDLMEPLAGYRCIGPFEVTLQP